MKKSTKIVKQMTNQQLHADATALFPHAGCITVTETIVSGSFDPSGDGKPWHHWSVSVYKFPVGEREGGNPLICSAHVTGSAERALADITAAHDKIAARHHATPQGFGPCPDCFGRVAAWYNEGDNVAVCDDCGQFLTLTDKEAA